MIRHSNKHWYLLCIIALGLTLSLCPAAHAKTIYVGSGSSWATIQSGIDAAADGDTVIVRPGYYTGPGNLNLDLRGKAIVLKSESGPSRCTIDAQHNGRGFYFHSGETRNTVIWGFTIKNGLDVDVQSDGVPGGGGILISGSSPTIRSCIISACESQTLINPGGGGGININSGSAPMIAGCTIAGNSSFGPGGGIFSLDSSPRIMNTRVASNLTSGSAGGGLYFARSDATTGSAMVDGCTIIGNGPVQDSTNALNGGGINCSSDSVSILNSTISGNRAANGAGIWGGSNLRVINCSVLSNRADAEGGGIHSVATGNRIVNTKIDMNVAQEGGGIWATGPFSAVNCSFERNSATDGGALFGADGEKVVVSNSTFFRNAGGALSFLGAGNIVTNCSFGIATSPWIKSTGSVYATNCIFWGNSAGFEPASPGQNILINYSDVQGGWAGTNNINANPLFMSSVDGDFHLRVNSPCINTGLNSGRVGKTVNILARPYDKDGNVITGPMDMGAYQYQGQ